MENFLLPNTIELFDTNRMSHFRPTMIFSYINLTLKERIFHSALICGPELCRRDGMMKRRLETNIYGYPLRLVLLFKLAYSDRAELILNC